MNGPPGHRGESQENRSDIMKDDLKWLTVLLAFVPFLSSLQNVWSGLWKHSPLVLATICIGLEVTSLALFGFAIRNILLKRIDSSRRVELVILPLLVGSILLPSGPYIWYHKRLYVRDALISKSLPVEGGPSAPPESRPEPTRPSISVAWTVRDQYAVAITAATSHALGDVDLGGFYIIGQGIMGAQPTNATMSQFLAQGRVSLTAADRHGLPPCYVDLDSAGDRQVDQIGTDFARQITDEAVAMKQEHGACTQD